MALISGLSLALAFEATAAEPEWEELFEDEGITVWRREIPGTSLVEFRGRGDVEASIVRVAAVVREDDRKVEWMKNCAGAATLQYGAAGSGIVYNRTGSPAPFIDDRDIVLDVKSAVSAADKTLRVDFAQTTHPKMPPVEGVVRMPQLRGHWLLRQVGPNRTNVTYQVRADPGGSLPKWLVNWVNKKLPYHTIAGLRDQTKKPGYDKVDQIVIGSYDWAGFDLSERAAAP